MTSWTASPSRWPTGPARSTPGWLADIARIGKGGNDRYFYGVRMMMVINQQGVATGWALASGNVQERWVAELLFSTRAGVPRVQGPLDAQAHQPKVTPPDGVDGRGAQWWRRVAQAHPER